MKYKKIIKEFLIITSFFLLFIFSHKAQALTITPIRIEVNGDPGKTLSAKITLINEKDTPETLYSSYANFEAQGETGEPSFVNPKEGLGTWITAEPSIVIAPKEQKEVTFKITIPANAEPGGYFGALFWGNTAPPKDGENAVNIGYKTAELILLTVNGEIKQGGAILQYGTKNNQKFYTALPVSFMYRFQNTGNDRVKPNGTITLRNFLGIKVATIPANKVDGNVLPKGVRKFESAWQKGTLSDSPDVSAPRNFFDNVGYEWNNFAFGYFSSNLNIEFGADKQSATAKTGFWVFPWQLLIVIIILIFIAWFIIKTALHRYNHWIITQAQVNIEQELGIDEKTKKISKKV